MIAQHHADGGVDNLGRNAVFGLVGKPRMRVPAAAVQIFEATAIDADLLRLFARGRDEAQCNGAVHTVNEEEVAGLPLVNDARRLVFPFGVDEIRVGIGRFSDMGIR